MTKVLMSGVQPTGIMHIGNYLLREDICQTLAILLSTGVDPLKTIIVQQSRVPELTELMWILGSASTLAVPIGLVTYPLLQAADVLGYHSTHVLVGSDQKQHLELLREIAHSFNYKTGTEYFSIPEQVHTSCPKIKSLCDPMVKMSKSDPKTKSFISLVDSTEIIVEKIKSALSDFKPEITFDPEKRPAISNLVMLYGEFSGMSTDQVIEDCRGLDTLAFKLHLASVIDKHLKPIRETYHQLMRDESILWEVLENGGKRARQIVTKTLEDIKTIVGFR
uniref:tryptophan--tRNA ligase n=1 Tax=Meloidogyne hapla TaxID=6305 RepID=A0A1I8BPS6_MELHA